MNLRAAPSLVLAGASLAFFFLTGVGASTGCGGDTAAAPTKICTPGNYVFCRCRDREEGTKLCQDDGRTFGKCEPCETDENGELPPEEDPEPRPPGPVDAGKDTGEPSTTCGDKIIQDGEDCDDGNKVDDDGCDSSCKLAGANPLSSRSCPGLPVHVWSAPVTWSSTTAGSTNTASAAPACGGTAASGSAAPDRVLQVTAHKTGTMTVATTDVGYNTFLYAAATCAAGGNATIACANASTGSAGETITFAVTDGTTYAVFVDGAGISNQEGAFKVTLSIK